MPAQAPADNTRPSLGLFRRRTLYLLMVLTGLLPTALPVSAADAAPPLMLAKVYHAGDRKSVV